jgi:hypothetical protein
VEVENNHAEKKTSRKTKKDKEESEEEVSGSESEYGPTESEESTSGSSSEEEMSESEKIVEKKKESSLKRKRGASSSSKKTAEKSAAEKSKVEAEKVKPPAKKQKKEEVPKDLGCPIEGEKSFKTKEASTTTALSKKPPTNFDVGRVDFNLHTEDPNNIVQKTVQISNSLKLTCKMLAGATVSAGKVTYPDWAALIFQKKVKDDKCFEFNISLRDAPKLIDGLKYIIEENKTFFKL